MISLTLGPVSGSDLRFADSSQVGLLSPAARQLLGIREGDALMAARALLELGQCSLD